MLEDKANGVFFCAPEQYLLLNLRAHVLYLFFVALFRSLLWGRGWRKTCYCTNGRLISFSVYESCYDEMSFFFSILNILFFSHSFCLGISCVIHDCFSVYRLWYDVRSLAVIMSTIWFFLMYHRLWPTNTQAILVIFTPIFLFHLVLLSFLEHTEQLDFTPLMYLYRHYFVKESLWVPLFLFL